MASSGLGFGDSAPKTPSIVCMSLARPCEVVGLGFAARRHDHEIV